MSEIEIMKGFQDVRLKRLLAWAAAVLVYSTVYGYRLNQPRIMYHDEPSTVAKAKEFLTLSGYTNDVHPRPPLGILMVAGSLAAFGDRPLAWRLSSFLAGFGCLAALFYLTLMLTRDRRIAFAAAGLFGLDGLSVTSARVATNHPVMLLFMLLSVMCLMKSAPEGGWSRRKAFCLSGLCLGLGVATRWVALSIAPILALCYVRLWRSTLAKSPLIRDSFVYLGLWPVLVYLSTFLIVPFLKGYDWFSIVTLQVAMAHFHLGLPSSGSCSSPWWSWPLLLHPVRLAFSLDQRVKIAHGVQTVHTIGQSEILALGNPGIVWLAVLGLGYAIWRFAKTRSWASQVVLAGFFTQWFQWALVSRLTYSYYFYTAMPFVAIALAMAACRVWDGGTMGRVVAGGYAAVVIAMFVYWYPMWTGMRISEAYYRQHLWLPSWV